MFRELAESTTFCLTFKSADVEQAFARRNDETIVTVAAPNLLLMPTVVFLASFAVPQAWSLHAIFFVLLVQSGVISAAFFAFYRVARHKVWIFYYETRTLPLERHEANFHLNSCIINQLARRSGIAKLVSNFTKVLQYDKRFFKLWCFVPEETHQPLLEASMRVSPHHLVCRSQYYTFGRYKNNNWSVY